MSDPIPTSFLRDFEQKQEARKNHRAVHAPLKATGRIVRRKVTFQCPRTQHHKTEQQNKNFDGESGAPVSVLRSASAPRRLCA